jgi:hypothetical protein
VTCRAGTGTAVRSETVDTTDALDISSGVDNNENHVRLARPLGHFTHCMPASGGDGYGRAPELSGTVEAAGSLYINGRAASNAASLGIMDGNSRALSGTVEAAGALDINGEVEGHGSHV